MWIEYNPSPTGRRVEDCAVRAVAKALDIDWEHAYALITSAGFAMGDMPHSNSVWGAVLRQHGFYRKSIPDTCPDCFSIKDFCKENPNGIFVLGTGNHVVTVIDGNYYDAWDSGDSIPQFVWYRHI